MPDIPELFGEIEVHSVEGINRYFDQGGSPNDVYEGKPIFTTMIEMYTRTPGFADCVRVFIDRGLKFEDPALLAVLSDNAAQLELLISQDPSLISKTYSLALNNAYTPLTGGTLMHFCAEYNVLACAKILVQHGADINARASLDEYGFGGHTPIFHTVNQNCNNSIDMLHFLLDQGADLLLTVKGLIWGKSYEWETFIPSVNPISYAMMGSLPQVHRRERTVSEIVSLLIRQAYGIEYTSKNVPNAYLAPKKGSA